MKGYHFTIIFAIIAYMVIKIVDLNITELNAAIYSRLRIEEAVNIAVDTAVKEMKTSVLHGEDPDSEHIYKAFYNTLSASLGIMDDPAQRELLHIYIPVMIIILNDGFYAIYNQEVKETENTNIIKTQTEKIPFSYEDEYFIYNLTIEDLVTVYDKNNILDSGVRINTMNYREIAEKLGAYINIEDDTFMRLSDKENYDIFKKDIIISKLSEYMDYYAVRNNYISEHYGINYKFNIPDIDNSELIRSIENIGIILLFQGYPYNNGNEYYNQYAVSGSVLKSIEKYYIMPEDYFYVYHKEGCIDLIDNSEYIIIYGKENCAEAGAFPCSICCC